MYGEQWVKQGFTKDKKTNVSNIVNYVIWIDKDGSTVGCHRKF